MAELRDAGHRINKPFDWTTFMKVSIYDFFYLFAYLFVLRLAVLSVGSLSY